MLFLPIEVEELRGGWGEAVWLRGQVTQWGVCGPALPTTYQHHPLQPNATHTNLNQTKLCNQHLCNQAILDPRVRLLNIRDKVYSKIVFEFNYKISHLGLLTFSSLREGLRVLPTSSVKVWPTEETAPSLDSQHM